MHRHEDNAKPAKDVCSHTTAFLLMSVALITAWNITVIIRHEAGVEFAKSN